MNDITKEKIIDVFKRMDLMYLMILSVLKWIHFRFYLL